MTSFLGELAGAVAEVALFWLGLRFHVDSPIVLALLAALSGVALSKLLARQEPDSLLASLSLDVLVSTVLFSLLGGGEWLQTTAKLAGAAARLIWHPAPAEIRFAPKDMTFTVSCLGEEHRLRVVRADNHWSVEPLDHDRAEAELLARIGEFGCGTCLAVKIEDSADQDEAFFQATLRAFKAGVLI